MFNIFTRTLPFTLLRALLFVLSGIMQFFIVYIIVQVGGKLSGGSGLLYVISKPMYIGIGLGLGVAVHRAMMKPMVHILSLGHVVASTVTLLNLPTEGSIFRYSVEQVKSCFLSLTVNSVVSISSVKMLRGLKDMVVKNDILPMFNEPKNKVTSFLIKMVTKDITSLLEMVDEVLVSYTWLTTDMYLKYDEDKKPGVRALAAKQASFMLEGVVFFLRAFPELFVKNLAYGALLFVINYCLVFAILFVIYTVIGFSWWIIPIAFLTHQVIKEILYLAIIYSLRLCAVLDSFYICLGKMDHVEGIDLVGLVQKAPCLSKLAKKSKLPEFKDLETTDTVTSEHLVDMSSLGASMKESVNGFAKAFMIKEVDLIKDDSEVPSDENESNEDEYSSELTEEIIVEEETEETVDVSATENEDGGAGPSPEAEEIVVENTGPVVNNISEFNELFD